MGGTDSNNPTPARASTNSAGNGNSRAGNTAGGIRKTDSLPKKKFEGRVTGLEGHVFDITGYKSQDLFERTLKEHVDHIRTLSQKYSYDAAEYIRTLQPPDWQAERPLRPKPTQDDKGTAVPVDAELLEDYQAELEEWKAKKKYVTINLKTAFGIVWSQCSDTIRTKVEKTNGFDAMQRDGQVITLLKTIRSTMMDYQEHKDVNQSHGEVLRKFYGLYQDKRSTLQEHRDRFDAMVAQVDYLGADVGHNPKAVAAILKANAVNPAKPTKDEQDLARAQAKEEFLAAYLIMTADKSKYSAVVERLENDKLLGRGDWPKTRNEAFDLLYEYKYDQRNFGNKPTANGMAFTTYGSDPQELDSGDEDNVSVNWSFLQATLTTCGTEENTDDPESVIPLSWILLDNQSTVDVFCNGDLLKNIREASGCQGIAIASNGGVSVTHLIGELPGYGTVWYDPNGIANILSFANVAKKWNISIETDKNRNPVFIVHKENGERREFIQSDRGLYYYDINIDGKSAKEVVLVNTVDDNKSRYSKRDYSRAALARKLQQRIGRPSTKHLIQIIENNQLPHCPITAQDVRNAEAIFGPDVGSLKGKTVWKKGSIPVPFGSTQLPVTIMEHYRDVTISIDVMYVNKLPFFVTMSHHIKFTTCEYMPKCKDEHLLKGIAKMRNLYEGRGFKISRIRGDGRFKSLNGADEVKGIVIDATSRDEHDPDIERNIRTLKDRVRSTYHTLPFNKCLPGRIVIEMVNACVFWLNCFHPSGGISSNTSPRTIITGERVDYASHCQLEFGEYVQTHEQHDNSMHARTTGALALRPSGNSRGGYLFFSLNTGRVLHRNRWTVLPMPNDVIEHVVRLGRDQKASGGLEFGNIDNVPIGDELNDYDDEMDTGLDDPDINEHEDAVSSDDVTVLTDNRNAESEGTREDNDEGGNWRDVDTEDSTGSVDDGTGDTAGTTGVDDDVEITGVDDIVESTGVGEGPDGGSHPTGHTSPDGEQADLSHLSDDAIEQSLTEEVAREFKSRYSLRSQPRVDYKNPDVAHRLPRSVNREVTMTNIVESKQWLTLCFEHAFVTTQYTMKKGLKEFGESGMNAVMKEMKQLHDRKVMFPKDARRLTREERIGALNYLMFLKEKRNGDIKGRGCADGRKQRVYKTKEETSSPTVTTESFFISATMDAAEGRDVAFVDVPGAFMHAKMPPGEVVHIKLKGEMAMLLVKIDPSLYKTYVVEERGQPVIYAQLTKALYGQLEAALLFWKLLTKQLESWGFKRNEYDWCVMNKGQGDDQCTVLWHVDDLKISHKSPAVVSDVIKKLDEVYGQEIVDGKRAELTVTRGKVHEYLGMKIDFSNEGKCVISMKGYLKDMFDELPEDMDGTVVTPAANHLFRVNPYAVKLKSEQAELFHHFVAKLLYVSRRARPDIQTAVSFLCTRVKQPDRDDWMKLRRVMRYLRKTVDLVLTLEAGAFNAQRLIEWWVDASYAVHADLKSHTGAFMTLGAGAVYACSSKQKINTKSSTEAELVGVDDIIGQSMWTINFIEAQGYAVSDNLIHQDNQSAILLEKNGRASSSKRTKHLNVRYFFITDRVKRGLAKIVYCPTKEMIGDFFTKPLQGALFRKFRNIIMNISDDNPCNDGLVAIDAIVDNDSVNDRSVLDGTNAPHVRALEVQDIPVEVRTAPFPAIDNGWIEVAHKRRKMSRQVAQGNTN